MSFESWIRTTGVKEYTATRYFNALKFKLSELAKEQGLSQSNLVSISNLKEFEAVSSSLMKSDEFIEINTSGNRMYSAALKKYALYLSSLPRSLEGDVESILQDKDKTPTEKARLINERIGQGKFRAELIKYWGRCAVTDTKETSLLVASHIKPWASSTDVERLDPFNGLLLCPNLDKAFDQGFISFDSTGQILISSHFIDLEQMCIDSSMSVCLSASHQSYMAYHRQFVFRG